MVFCKLHTLLIGCWSLVSHILSLLFWYTAIENFSLHNQLLDTYQNKADNSLFYQCVFLHEHLLVAIIRGSHKDNMMKKKENTYLKKFCFTIPLPPKNVLRTKSVTDETTIAWLSGKEGWWNKQHHGNRHQSYQSRKHSISSLFYNRYRLYTTLQPFPLPKAFNKDSLVKALMKYQWLKMKKIPTKAFFFHFWPFVFH